MPFDVFSPIIETKQITDMGNKLYIFETVSKRMLCNYEYILLP